MADYLDQLVLRMMEGDRSADSSIKQFEGPHVLYHFTDAAGLRGILSPHVSLRLTHSEHLNDPSEGRVFQQYLKEAGGPILRDLGLPPARVELVKTWKDVAAMVLPELLDWIGTSESDYYVACFSEATESASQWRLYADDGHGFAIGFGGRELAQALYFSAADTVPIGWYGPSLLRVFYTEEEHRALAKAFFTTALQRLRELWDYYGEDESRRAALTRSYSSELWKYASRMALMCKHAAYSDEREWRLTVDASAFEALAEEFSGPGHVVPGGVIAKEGHLGGLGVRWRGSALVPFAEAQLSSDRSAGGAVVGLVKELVRGPCRTSRLDEAAIEAWLALATPLENVHIRPANIPYRANAQG